MKRSARASAAKGVTQKQLEREAKTLEGATMPNGEKYEDWLKDKQSRRENGQSRDQS
jgi:hypothetical protein